MCCDCGSGYTCANAYSTKTPATYIVCMIVGDSNAGRDDCNHDGDDDND